MTVQVEHESPPRDAGGALRVALFVHAFFPDQIYGTESYALALARQLMRLGHEAVVVTVREDNGPPQAEEVERFSYAGIPVVRIDRSRTPPRDAREEYDMPALVPLFRRILAEIRPDVAHICHLGNFTTALATATRGLGIPTFTTLTDFFNLCMTGTLEVPGGGLCDGPDAHRANCMACGIALRRYIEPSRFWRTLAQPGLRPLVAAAGARLAAVLPFALGRDARAVVERPQVLLAAMEQCRAAIAPTLYLHDAFRRHGAQLPLVHSTFGIDIDRAEKPLPRPDGAPGPLRCGFIGQLLTHKGPHLLVNALRQLPPGSFTLDIWGSEQLHPDYARDLREVARGMAVAFRGTFEESATAAIFAGMDVVVLPSTWRENGPLTLLKALATHTPAVVSDVPGMTEFITEGVNGFAFRRGDVAALAEVLRRFVTDPGLARRMSGETHYPRTEADMARDVLGLYRRFGVGLALSGSGA